jgi:hypothetical protein
LAHRHVNVRALHGRTHHVGDAAGVGLAGLLEEVEDVALILQDLPEHEARQSTALLHRHREQVKLGCVPYYMFVARDTGAQHYFSVPLVRAWEIFRKAYTQVSGAARIG